jgi:hypothetical protein
MPIVLILIIFGAGGDAGHSPTIDSSVRFASMDACQEFQKNSRLSFAGPNQAICVDTVTGKSVPKG